MRYARLAGDLGRYDTLLEEIGGTHAPLLHRGKSRRGRTRRAVVLAPQLYRNILHDSVSQTTHLAAAYFASLFLNAGLVGA